jgi:hypothetical protein
MVCPIHRGVAEGDGTKGSASFSVNLYGEESDECGIIASAIGGRTRIAARAVIALLD